MRTAPACPKKVRAARHRRAVLSGAALDNGTRATHPSVEIDVSYRLCDRNVLRPFERVLEFLVQQVLLALLELHGFFELRLAMGGFGLQAHHSLREVLDGPLLRWQLMGQDGAHLQIHTKPRLTAWAQNLE